MKRNIKAYDRIIFMCGFTLFSISASCQYLANTKAIIHAGYADTLNKRSVTMSAGNQFAASRSKQFWWGKHWRDEWIKPASFQVFDLDTMAGGLTPLERGGGHQTKSLRLLGKNGKEYVLRTIDKNLDVLVPEELKGSFVNDVANDQISIAHPYAPLVVAALANSIGILHTNPVIGYVPDNPRLDSFKNDFVNKLCLFEERPSGDGWENTGLTNFAGSIINSEKLFIKIMEDNKKQVDQKEFLKVRLFDMLINDWDRHEDQWVWASQKKDGKTIYKPFARDRDQAFSKTDGVNLYLISRPWALRALQNMDANVRDVIGTNISARFLDKKFTTELTEVDWKSTIVLLQRLLTDSVISSALKQMPPPIYDLSGDFLFRRLRQRRDNMLIFGLRYYKILNKEVTVTGSDEQELFTINKIEDGVTEIIVQDLDKENQPADIIYHRLFDHSVTKEINLYGLAGNDQFVFTGKSRNNIFIRVIGGDGKDSFSNSTKAINGGKKSNIYDSPSEKPTAWKSFRYRSTTDTSLTNYNRKLFNYDWWCPLIIPGYNPDDGFVIGAGVIYRKRQWNKTPYGWEQIIGANYAAATGAYNIFYRGKFRHALGKWDLDLTANYKAPGYVVNFYGLGNDTKLISSDKDFFRVRATSLFFNPAVSHSWKKNFVKTGLVFNSVKVQSNENKFVNQGSSSIDSSVFSTKYFAGADLSYVFNTTNNLKYPTKGIIYQAGTSYWINLEEGKRNFVNLQSNFTFYYSPFERITIAHRTGAATNIGDYEFYQANTIGGNENLRGYWRTRFTGGTSFYQNTDLRIKIAMLKGYVLRGSLGIYGFFDDGRVWIKDDHSNVLHYGYGGGIYFIPYNRLAINLSYASSKEVNVFTVRTGFLF
jgi:hypothetical protein